MLLPFRPLAGDRSRVDKERQVSMGRDTQARILIIDDEASLAEPLTQILEGEGHSVRSATDARKAIPLIEQFEPDLVITTIVMAEVDMIAAFRWVGPEIKIIAISGESHLIRVAARQGADHVLPKPVRLGELNALVKKLLGPG